jgi:hypothetical protein
MFGAARAERFAFASQVPASGQPEVSVEFDTKYQLG